METIVINGKPTPFVVTSNGYYKFYLCDTFSEAEDLKSALKDSEVIFTQILGWAVRVSLN